MIKMFELTTLEMDAQMDKAKLFTMYCIGFTVFCTGMRVLIPW